MRLKEQSDGQMDGQTERPWQYRVLHYMQSHGKNDQIQTKSIQLQLPRDTVARRSDNLYRATAKYFQGLSVCLLVCLFVKRVHAL